MMWSRTTGPPERSGQRVGKTKISKKGNTGPPVRPHQAYAFLARFQSQRRTVPSGTENPPARHCSKESMDVPV